MFNIKTMIIAALVFVVGLAAGYGVGQMRGFSAGATLGAAKARLEAESKFNKAVGELSNEADQARVLRRLCVDGGGVYDFANGQCAKGKNQQ